MVILAGGWLLSLAWHISLGHGLYCAVGVATTEGCDTGPTSAAGRLVAVGVILVAVPLLAAVFALLTGHHAARRASGWVHEHVSATEKRLTAEADQRHVIMQTHVERLLRGHTDELKAQLAGVIAGQAEAAATAEKARAANAAAEIREAARRAGTPPKPGV
jgi:hypothetical protein